MTKTTTGIATWPIIAQVSILMGCIMQFVDYILKNVGYSNIIFYILFFVIISKIILSPLIVKNSRSSFLKLKTYEDVKKIDEKYKNKDLNKYKLKVQAERQFVQKKYGTLQNGCSTFILQLLIVIGLYAVLKDLDIYVPRIGSLPQNEIIKIYTCFGIYLKDSANIKNMTTFIFPGFAAVADAISLFANEKLSQAKTSTKKSFDPSIIVSPIITFLLCFKFPLFIAVYWGVQSLASTLINIILRIIFNKRGEGHYIHRELQKFNNNRKKRGLEPLDEIPTV